MCLRRARPALRSVEDSQDDYLSLAKFVDGDEREQRKSNLARALNPTNAPEVRKRLQRPDALDHRLCHPSRGFRTAFRNVVGDPFEIVLRRPSSSGRASAAIVPIHAGRDFIVIEEPAFAGSSPTRFDFAAEPLVVVN
jgi:hypothetical protein